MSTLWREDEQIVVMSVNIFVGFLANGRPNPEFLAQNNLPENLS